MMKMISMALAAVLALSMTACGSSAAPDTTASVTGSTDPSTTETIMETTQSIPVDAFEEMVLVDNDDLTFKITGVEEDSIWGYTLKVFLENKTDKELMFSLNDTSVNGFMCDPFWAETVSSGKKSNTTISWFESDFTENGIESVEEIVFTLRVYDSDDWMAEDVLKETFTVNP